MLAGAALVGISPGRAIPNAFLAVLVGIIGMYMLYRWQNLGMMILFIGALSISFSVATGSQTNLHVAILIIPVLLIVTVIRFFREHRASLVPSVVNLPALLFLAGVLISFIAGNMPWIYQTQVAPITAQLGGFAILLFSILLMLIVGNTQRDTRLLKCLVVLLITIAVITALSRVSSFFAVITGLIVREPGATGSMFWVWAEAFAAGMCIFNTTLRKPVRILLGVCAFFLVAIAIISNSNWTSGWLPLIVVLSVLLGIKSKTAAVLIAVVAIYVVVNRPDLLNLVQQQETYSIITREAAWTIMFQNIIPISPVIGLGPSNYYFYTSLFNIMGYHLKFNSHNQYIDLLAQVGIAGTVFYIWIMVALLKISLALRKQASIGFNRAYAYCCVAGIAGTVYAGMHGDWVLPFVYNIGIEGFRASMLAWLFLGGLMTVEQITLAETTPKAA